MGVRNSMWSWNGQMLGSWEAEPDTGISWDCALKKEKLLRKWKEKDKAEEDSQAWQ